MRIPRLAFRALAFSFALAAISGVTAHAEEISGELVIFHAGSLTVPLEAMEKTFEAAHPGVDVVLSGGGSTKMARMISEEGQAADIMASADYVVIDKNLIPKFASWNARFASNQMVLCHTAQSKYADEVNAENWTEILLREDVSWGHSDPDLDPAGYRSLMVLQLAEAFRKEEGLYEKLIASRPAENVRPKAIELVALLKSGELDYAWEYRSVAVQHGLEFVTLDNHINLGDYRMDDFYKDAVVEVAGKQGGEPIKRVGKSITYGVTMLDNAKNPVAAEAFLAYLFAPEGGLAVLEAMGQPPFIPVRVPSQQMKDAMPEGLAPLVTVTQ